MTTDPLLFFYELVKNSQKEIIIAGKVNSSNQNEETILEEVSRG